MDAQRTRILRLVRERGLDLAALSRAVGKNHAYFQQFIKRGTPRRLPEDVREALCARFGIHPDELSARGAASAPGRALPVLHYAGEEYGAVRAMAGRVAAGAGGESDDGERGSMLFRMPWLRSVTSAPLESLAVIPVDGDSMEPTLRTGDHALVDLTQRKPQRKDGLYVLRSADGLQVKRVSAHPATGRLAIRSDNSAYESYTDVDPASVEILGRVIWIGRRI
jgi:phage repressor protein C with HTH and peptisase S24 domain